MKLYFFRFDPLNHQKSKNSILNEKHMEGSELINVNHFLLKTICVV